MYGGGSVGRKGLDTPNLIARAHGGPTSVRPRSARGAQPERPDEASTEPTINATTHATAAKVKDVAVAYVKFYASAAKGTNVFSYDTPR